MIVIRLSILLFALAILQGCNSSEPTTATNTGITKAEIRQTDGNYQLFINGAPFFIEGAGLEFGNVEALAKHGGNSFRTWRTDNGQSSGKEVLDRAQASGLYVTMGIEVARERHGFDYNDEAAVKEQFERIKTEIQAYKDHPALIIWAIGNELNLRATNPKVWDAVNQISEYIHEVDPNHLTTSTLAGIDKELVDNIKERAADLDLLSIQMYADIVNLKQKVTESGWTGPYMVTEWGATGHWEVGTTEWEAPIENNSTQKANFYLERYQTAILPNRDQCVGSYVFLWGQKQERTPTWYGMFMPDGEETASVDVMHYLWNDTWPDNRSPQLDSFLLDGKVAESSIYLEAGKSYTSEVFANDPDGDALAYHYEIKPESTDLGDGGDHESVPPSMEGLITENGKAAITFTAPETEGAYRILVTVADGQNHMGHANIPFFVKGKK